MSRVNSPRMRSRATRSRRTSATVPRRNSSWSLVSSRAATTRRLGPKTDSRSARRVGDAVRGFVEDHGLRRVAGLSGQVFEARATGAGFLRQESEELEFAGGQS